MQTQKRATQRKVMKKGRKGKKGKKGKKGHKTAKTSATASKSKPSKTVGNSPMKKLGIIKQHLKKQGSETDTTVPAATSKTRKGKTTPASKAKAKKETKVESPCEALPPPRKVYQDRVTVGKTWRYMILPDQQFGCANCRFIYGGCRTCQNPKFRGKSAKEMREFDALQGSGSAGAAASDSASKVAVAKDKPRRKRKASTEKGKKGAKKVKGATKSIAKDVD